jgi:hypothetical protein
LILLARINVVVRNGNAKRSQARYIRKAVVPDAEEREFVIADVKDAGAVDLKLLPMFEPVQKTVAIRSLRQNPGMGVRAKSSDEVEVPIITRQPKKGSN